MENEHVFHIARLPVCCFHTFGQYSVVGDTLPPTSNFMDLNQDQTFRWKVTTFLPMCDGDHGGRVVTLSLPTSEVGVRFLARKLVVACRWSVVYSTEP